MLGLVVEPLLPQHGPGVGDAQLFLGLMSRDAAMWNTSTLIASLPVATSNPSNRSERPLSSTAVVSHTLPPETTGEDQPNPGSGVFQVTLRVSLHSSGRFCSREWPWPSGPRNAGQS